MFNFSKILSCSLALAVVVASLTGCGKSNQSSDSVGGAAMTRSKPTYKANDRQLVSGSNNIPVYSTPDSARKALRRSPDQTVDEGNGVVTQYYNGDQTNANSERLRLRYAQNRLIGKEIVPADSNGATPTPAEVNASARNAGAINVQGLEGSGTGGSARSLGTSNYYGNTTATPRAGSSSDHANNRANEDFNAQLNNAQRR